MNDSNTRWNYDVMMGVCAAAMGWWRLKGSSTWRKKGTGRGMRISRCMLPTVGSCTQRQCPVRCQRGGESTARRPCARSRRARGRALDERAVAHAWRACESPESFPCLFIAVLGSPPHHLHLGCNMAPGWRYCRCLCRSSRSRRRRDYLSFKTEG